MFIFFIFYSFLLWLGTYSFYVFCKKVRMSLHYIFYFFVFVFMCLLGDFFFDIFAFFSVFKRAVPSIAFGFHDKLLFETSTYVFSAHFVFSTILTFILFSFFGFFLLFYFFYWIKPSPSFCLFFSLFSFYIFFSILLIASSDLWVIYFVSELLTFLGIVLFGIHLRGSFNNMKPLLIYFILNTLISILFFAVIFFIFSATGTTDTSLLLNRIPSESHLCFLFIIFFFKLGLFPFHFVFIDLYENLSWPVFAFFSYFTKLIFFIVVLKFFHSFVFLLGTFWLFYLLIFSILVGSCGVVVFSSIRSLFVFSSIFNTSFALLIAYVGHSDIALYYYFIYCIFSILLIWYINFFEIITQKNFDFIFNYGWSVSSFFFVLLFSLMGLPPLFFFFFKSFGFLIFLSKFSYFFTLLLIFFSGLVTFGYIRLIKRVLFG